MQLSMRQMHRGWFARAADALESCALWLRNGGGAAAPASAAPASDAPMNESEGERLAKRLIRMSPEEREQYLERAAEDHAECHRNDPEFIADWDSLNDCDDTGLGEWTDEDTERLERYLKQQARDE